MKIQPLAGAWEFCQAGAGEWLPAAVPGGVHTDLLALGRIPDPFAGDNETRVAWVAEADWEYRRRFTLAPEILSQPRVWLVCDGLDTLATVSLNGQVLGRANNMFRQYRWDVRPLLRTGENELRIAFDSPVKYIAAQQALRPMVSVSQGLAGGPHLRKAPSQFGWDWGPQLPPIGIWKDIRLEGFSARLADVHLRQQHGEGGRVTVTAEIAVEAATEAELTASLKVTSPDGTPQPGAESLLRSSVDDPGRSASLKLEVQTPQLWWPNGWGSQPLYQVSVELRQGSLLLDRRDYNLGLRTIELRQQPDEWGRSFQFVVNGLPIFAKGANWIPADSFPTRISDAHIEKLIRSVAATHQNMLRVWGGGFYEQERFYDLCDRYGILVWQEFIFSCSIYPLDNADFLENVRLEVKENVKRLRHRASLALWCGNNEMEEGWESWGWARHPLEEYLPTLVEQVPALSFLMDLVGTRTLLADWEVLKNAYDDFFHKTLPGWVAAFDPDRPYWPSSPSSDTPFQNVNGQAQGDAHYWDVWHGRKPFTAYRGQYPRFMSEFGFQALSPLATIRTYAGEADWNMTSYVMERHQKNDRGNALMVSQMLDTFRLPKDFESLVYLSMVLQAEGIRYGVEHWRRSPKRVAGTLYWQLNDCWPGASWSSLDYFGRWKALHYAARRFYAPLLLSIADQPPVQEVHLTNDTPRPWEGSLRWSLETLEGNALDSGEAAVTAAPFDATRLIRLDFSDRLTGDLPRETVFVVELCQGGRVLNRQTAFFAPTKHLALADPSLATHVYLEEERIHIELTARSLARLVEITLEGAEVVFSDNYFDLPAGRTAVVSAPLPEGWTLPQTRAALKVRTIYDSYAHGAAN